jgi:outer membrane lipoprotein-sorting protein
MPLRARSPVVVLALVALLVTSGCTAVPQLDGGGGPDLPTGEAAADGYRSFDTVEATVTTVVDDANTTTTRQHVVRDPSAGLFWQETLAPEERAGDLVVSNRSVTWSYDASANEATRIDSSEFDAAADAYPDYLWRLFEALRGDGDDPSAVGVSPLPVVPSTPAPTPDGESFRQFVVEYNGTTTVDGRTAHVVHMEASDPGEEFAVLNQTLYLDAEYFYPLEQRSSYRFRGNVTTYTVTHSDVTFDPDVDPGRFRFDPPAGTNVSETTLPDSDVYDSRAALRANTSLEVPDPEVPAGFSLTGARRTVSSSMNYTSVALTYENATGVLSVTTRNTTDVFTGLGDNETVDIDGRSATYREFGATRTVQWTCEGAYYAVSSNALSRSALLDVARSVTCASAASATPTPNATAHRATPAGPDTAPAGPDTTTSAGPAAVRPTGGPLTAARTASRR